jgi:hypothetical protein
MARWSVGIAMVFVWSATASAQEPAPRTEPPGDKQIAELIARLGDARFERRRDAHNGGV